MERPATDTTAARPADDDRNPRAIAIPAGCREIRQHVEAACDEIDELDLAHRAHAHVRRTDGGADDCLLRNRRIHDPLLAVLLDQPLGDLERAAIRADILAHHEYALISRHLLEQRLPDR